MTIEETVIGYLNGSGLEVTAYAEVPKDPDDSFIIIERTGGDFSNHLSSCMMAVQTYGASMLQAAALAESVKDVMLQMVSLNRISSVTVNSGPYNFTDTSAKRYRYQTVYDIFYY